MTTVPVNTTVPTNTVPVTTATHIHEALRNLICENLDPKYFNQPSTTVDIMFLDIPDDILAMYDPKFDLKISQSIPGTRIFIHGPLAYIHSLSVW